VSERIESVPTAPNVAENRPSKGFTDLPQLDSLVHLMADPHTRHCSLHSERQVGGGHNVAAKVALAVNRAVAREQHLSHLKGKLR
jgi:hypothetical protein